VMVPLIDREETESIWRCGRLLSDCWPEQTLTLASRAEAASARRRLRTPKSPLKKLSGWLAFSITFSTKMAPSPLRLVGPMLRWATKYQDLQILDRALYNKTTWKQAPCQIGSWKQALYDCMTMFDDLSNFSCVCIADSVYSSAWV
jgi:hypothetical protein